MLKKMFIKNFALIENLAIDFHSGFNALTGETGAGKSIIIDAVDIVLGGQGLTEFIRSGEQTALIESFFDITENQKVKKVLEKLNLLPDENEYLILSRELVKTGKNVSRINGRHVNLSIYKEVTQNLVDIYGQHHQQSLLDPQKHIELLDEYGGGQIASLKQDVSVIYNHLLAVQTKLNEMEFNEKEQARMADIYKYQFDEIENHQLCVGDDLSLAEEKSVLLNSDKLAVLSGHVYELLYGSQKSATDLLNEAVKDLKDILVIDQTVKPFYEALETALYQVEEVARDVRTYESQIESDPQRLQEIDNRLTSINQLKKKYGNTIEEILEYQKQISASMETAENWEKEILNIRRTLAETETKYNQLANRLTAARKMAADLLAVEITNELKELNIPHVSFKVNIVPKSVEGSNGLDDIEFLISPNIGEPLKPLAKIVSGGEISRIMLAFKTILAEADSISTMIFDEVDAGVGGIALQAVARKLASIGSNRQVICVTHSPHIASYADNHYQIIKSIKNGRTLTMVNFLHDSERVDEIARMLSGNVTSITRTHAKEILNSANNKKQFN